MNKLNIEKGMRVKLRDGRDAIVHAVYPSENALYIRTEEGNGEVITLKLSSLQVFENRQSGADVIRVL